MLDNKKYKEIYEYAEGVIGTPVRLRAAFYILEAFDIKGFDLIVSLDSDMVILGSLDPITYDAINFSAVRARDAWTNFPAEFVNSGLMVIGKKYLINNVFPDFLTAMKSRPLKPGAGKADQAILNIYFGNKCINYLSQKFNFTKRSLYSVLEKKRGLDSKPFDSVFTAAHVKSLVRELDVRVLHYVSEKPWKKKEKIEEQKFEFIEELWFEEFYSYANDLAVSKLGSA